MAQPDLRTWTLPDAPVHLTEKTAARPDQEPIALACYGLYVRATATQAEHLLLRFATGRPVSAHTTQFLAWCLTELAAQGKRVLVLVWDNAAWHRSRAVRRWISAAQPAGQSGRKRRADRALLPAEQKPVAERD